MAINIEIKAKATNFGRQIALATALADGPAIVIEQEDLFFEVPDGRLKLRIFSSGSAELIAYERIDQAGPKSSNYSIYPTNQPALLQAALTSALPLGGRVKKRRTLFMKGRTRIHFDEVEMLGQFIELEAVLADGESRAQGESRVGDLMPCLAIAPSDLIAVAYIDLLRTSTPTTQ